MQKMEGDCQAAHQAKVVVRQELRATQKILQEIKAQAKDDSLKHKKALAQQSSQDAQPEDTHSSVRRYGHSIVPVAQQAAGGGCGLAMPCLIK